MKKIFNFALYDFANSAFTTIIITFIFATYFATQIAPNPMLGQSYWGWTIGITGFLVAIIGPIVGSFADKKNRIVFFIRFFSLLCILFTSLLWFSKPSQSYLLYTLVVVGVANLFYELSLIFYNSLLKDISKNKNLGKSSGFGFALGYIGGIIILLISIKLFIDTDSLPFGLSKEESENIRAVTLLVSIWFLIFSIPFLFFVIKESKNKITIEEDISPINEKIITILDPYLSFATPPTNAPTKAVIFIIIESFNRSFISRLNTPTANIPPITIIAFKPSAYSILAIKNFPSTLIFPFQSNFFKSLKFVR